MKSLPPRPSPRPPARLLSYFKAFSGSVTFFFQWSAPPPKLGYFISKLFLSRSVILFFLLLSCYTSVMKTQSKQVYPAGDNLGEITLSCGHPAASVAPVGMATSLCFPNYLCNNSRHRSQWALFLISGILIPRQQPACLILYQYSASQLLCVCLQKISKLGCVT